MNTTPTPASEAHASLKRIQEFDAGTLARVEDLGRQSSFEAAVAPAERAIALFRQLPLSSLGDFPKSEQDKVKQLSDALFNSFSECLNFSISGQTEGNITAKRDNIINQITNSYQNQFTQLYPLISYASSRTIDFSRLEAQGRAAVQAVQDRADSLTSSLESSASQAKEIVEAVRKAAAEQGVAQQASYFKAQADEHCKAATNWMWITVGFSGVLLALAIASFFAHKLDLFASEKLGYIANFIAAKIILFGTVAYLVALSARNFLSHKHNEIVNRHRQNALMTFQALVKAADLPEAQDIVLSHASSCIFAPQPTGYTKGPNTNSGNSGLSAADMMPRVAAVRQLSTESPG